MEPQKPGSKNMPDFDRLNDRIIAEHTEQPMLVIKTNLDPKTTGENNPYYKDEETVDKREFDEFFKE